MTEKRQNFLLKKIFKKKQELWTYDIIKNLNRLTLECIMHRQQNKIHG